MEAKLVVVGGKANRSEVKLKLPAMLGRGRDVDVTVAHATVSRHHCLIYELDGALVVRDNGSLNGTLVEGRRIKEALLRPGQSLTIGPLTFRAEYDHNGNFPQLGAPVPAAADSQAENQVKGPAAADERAAENFDFLDDDAADEPAGAASNTGGLSFLNETDDGPADSADSFDFLDDEPASPPATSKAAAAKASDSQEVFRLADEPPASAKKDAKARDKSTSANGSAAKSADEPLGVNASAGEAAKHGGHDDPALDNFLNSLGLDE
ncbi:MAG TPA: FHA domain-containing protein [Pirellulales bacterium]|nr:FHA domain-containing protein [Pirellulales bacterium]